MILRAAAFFAIGAAALGGGAERPRGVVEDCSTRSEAEFPDAYSNPQNLVVGPLVLVGGAFTSADTVRRFRGNKFPLLVANGHRVTLQLSRSTRRHAGLAYGPLPEGYVHFRDAHRVVTFTACRRDERSGSRAGRRRVTFWSGFVLARSPRCVPLHVWVDDEPRRLVWLRMGVARCP